MTPPATMAVTEVDIEAEAAADGMITIRMESAMDGPLCDVTVPEALRGLQLLVTPVPTILPTDHLA